jgi:tetratricopeptide (TPR) repeat protein
MANQPENEWRKTFCGRDSELNELIARWAEVKAGNGPRFVGIIADRGMGKTRLAQQFYAWLAENEDPDNYWPDGVSFVGTEMQPGPDVLRDTSVAAHFQSFNLIDRPMPFLWWGMRIAAIDEHNPVRTALESHAQTLSPHLAPMAYARRLKANKQKLFGIGEGARDYGASLVENGMDKAIEGLGSWLGPAKFLFVAGKRLIEFSDEQQRLSHDLAVADIVSVGRERQHDVLEQILAPMREFLLIREDSVPIPVVILIDDAQFARVRADEGTLRFMSDLWEFACANNSPLMMIATHWADEWESCANEPETVSFAGRFFKTVKHRPDCASTIELGTHPDLSDLIKAGLPMLEAKDEALLLARADGNPMLLAELIDTVRESRAWRSLEGGLSDYGRTEIEKRTFKIHDLVLNRLKDKHRTPTQVRDAIALGAVQGMEFLRAVVIETGKDLGIEIPQSAIDHAATPHVVVTLQGLEGAAFRQRVMKDVAQELARLHLGPIDEVSKAVQAAVERLKKNATASTMFTPQEFLSLKGLSIGLLDYTASPEEAQKKAAALLTLLPDLSNGIPDGTDVAEAVRVAEEFIRGVDQGNWSLKGLDYAKLFHIVQILEYWRGPKSALDFAKKLNASIYVDPFKPDRVQNKQNKSIAYQHVARLLIQSDQPKHAIEALEDNVKLLRFYNETERTAFNELMLLGALLQSGDAYCDLGEQLAGRDVYREVISIVDRSVEVPSYRLSEYKLCALERLFDLEASTYSYTDGEAKLIDLVDQSANILDETGSHHAKLGLAGAIGRLATWQEKSDDLAKALETRRRNKAICEELAQNTGTVNDLEFLSSSLVHEGDLLAKLRRPQEAFELFERGLAIDRQIVELHPNRRNRRMLSVSLQRVGEHLRTHGQAIAAIEYHKEGLAIVTQLEAELPDLDYRRGIRNFKDFLGGALCEVGSIDDGLLLLEQALNLTRDRISEFDTNEEQKRLMSIQNEIEVWKAEGSLPKEEKSFRINSKFDAANRLFFWNSFTPKLPSNDQIIGQLLSMFKTSQLLSWSVPTVVWNATFQASKDKTEAT